MSSGATEPKTVEQIRTIYDKSHALTELEKKGCTIADWCKALNELIEAHLQQGNKKAAADSANFFIREETIEFLKFTPK